MSVAQRLFTRLVWLSGLSRLARAVLVADGRFVLEFHGVAARRHQELPLRAQPALVASDLRRILLWVRKRFRWLEPQELMAGGTAGPGVLLTFDDGFANQAAVAKPILEELGAPAVFFVTTRHLRDPRDWLPSTRKLAVEVWGEAARVPETTAAGLFDGMSPSQLADCAASEAITIGSHTESHPSLPACDDRQLEDELRASRRYLSEAIGQPVDLLAYPSGEYDARVAARAEELGYRAAFAEDRQRLAPLHLEIPRVGLYRADPAYLSVKLSGLHRPALEARTRLLPPRPHGERSSPRTREAST